MSSPVGFIPSHQVPPQGMAAWSQPDPSMKPVGALSPGAGLKLLNISGAWAQVADPLGNSYWVDYRLLVPMQPAGLQAQAQALGMQTAPSGFGDPSRGLGQPGLQGAAIGQPGLQGTGLGAPSSAGGFGQPGLQGAAIGQPGLQGTGLGAPSSAGGFGKRPDLGPGVGIGPPPPSIQAGNLWGDFSAVGISQKDSSKTTRMGRIEVVVSPRRAVASLLCAAATAAAIVSCFLPWFKAGNVKWSAMNAPIFLLFGLVNHVHAVPAFFIKLAYLIFAIGFLGVMVTFRSRGRLGKLVMAFLMAAVTFGYMGQFVGHLRDHVKEIQPFAANAPSHVNLFTLAGTGADLAIISIALFLISAIVSPTGYALT
jgi:hypothetical protein